MKNIFTLLFLSFFAFSSFSQNLVFEEYATGFSSPVDITNAGDDRLFIVERSGRIKIIDGTGTVLSTPFLDIDNIVHNASFQSEQGLLGLTFHPDYANNGYFFVNYINNSDNTVIARYSVDPSDPNLADDSSAEIIMTINQPAGNHNGGCIKFGPDGYLYIGMGDGGSANDPFGDYGNGQNVQTLLGKMLRIDIDNGSPYSIPADNPFADDDFVLDEIWAIGLRNPWRFSFDRETGDLWIGDVGQGGWEEIDYQPASSPGGENYGWRCYEGNHFTNLTGANDCNGPFTNPVYEIAQSSGGGTPCSITGGFVYRGSEFPDLIGKYICADYCSGEFFIVQPDGANGWTGQEVADPNYSVSSFGEDVNGELYIARFSNGRIYKITTDACAGLAVSANVTNEPCEGETNGSATLSGAGGTPPYTYAPAIDFNNLSAGNYTITITDSGGCQNTTTFTINSLALPLAPTVTVNDNDLTSSGGFVAYQWYLNGQPIVGATSQSYSISESGNYSVEVTDANGCKNISTETNVTYTSLESIPALNEFKITPNPFEKNINVEISVNESIDLDMVILDVAGKNVFTKKISINENYNESLNLEFLPVGVYYLNLKSENGLVVKKLIKQ